MRVDIEHDAPVLRIAMRLDPHEDVAARGQMGAPIELMTDAARIELDEALPDPHPDLIALAVLTIVAPWVGTALTIDTGVSAGFAAAVRNGLGFDVGPVDPSVEPRPAGTHLGLLYSGGPDCMAAESLLGEDLTLYHFRRVPHPAVPDRMAHVQMGLQEQLVRQAVDRGRTLHVARSDLEYICLPRATFPRWNALTVGAILRADADDLGGLVTGRNISGIHLGWGSTFSSEGEDEVAWEAAYAAAGLPLVQPVAGVTDITSKRLAQDHPLVDLARSCLLGDRNGPCLSCTKCLLNDLIGAATAGEPLPPGWSDTYLRNASIVRMADGVVRFHNQQLVEFALARIPDIESTFLGPAAERLAPSVEETAWAARCYRAGMERVPTPWRARVEAAIEERVGFMTAEDERRTETWTADN